MFNIDQPNYGLKEKVIDIWLCQSDALQDRRDYFSSLLSSEEKARAERFKFDIHRNRFIISHGFMRAVLAKYLKIEPYDIQYQQGDKGKPCLENETHTLKFNLSHTQDVAILAVTKDAEVGVDIEYIDRKTDWQGICQRFFTEPEQQALFALDQAQQERSFFELWTRKEAYMKLLGTGLSLSPTKFTLTVPPQRPALVKHHSTKYQSCQQTEFVSITLPDTLARYCATLAVASSIWECRYYHFA